MGIYTHKSVSPVGQVNKKDINKIIRDTAIFFAPAALIYLAQLTGTLNQNKVIFWSDFIPNLMTIGALEGWFIGIVINFFLKLRNSKE